MLKDGGGVYRPNARSWLKVKRDYLSGGMMADSADLVVLGAYFGTGSHGGQMTVFLMGVFDEEAGIWKTVSLLSSVLPLLPMISRAYADL